MSEVVVGLAMIALVTGFVSFGFSSGCTNNANCTDSWCSQCDAVNWLPIVQFLMQISVAVGVLAAVRKGARAGRAVSLRRSWMSIAVGLFAVMVGSLIVITP